MRVIFCTMPCALRAGNRHQHNEQHPVHARRHHPSPPARPARRPDAGSRRRGRYRDHGPQPASRPALPGAALRRRRPRPPGAAHPARSRRSWLRLPQPEPPARRSGHGQADALRPLRRGDAAAQPRHHRRSGALHQDRRPADPHLHRPPRPQGPLQGTARGRSVQAAADLGLGCGGTDRGAARLRRLRRAAPARAVGEAGGAAGSRGAPRTGGSLLGFLPARARLDLLGYEQPDIFAH